MKYRVGRKQKRALLDEQGLEVALFHKGQEGLAERVCELLNGQASFVNVEKSLPNKDDRFLVLVHRPSQMRASIEIARRYLHKPAINDRRLDKNFLIHGTVTHWAKLPDINI